MNRQDNGLTASVVHLFYLKVKRECVFERFDFYLKKLPPRYRSSILVCKNPATRVLRLASRLLLDTALKFSGVPEGLRNIDFTPEGRPFIAGETDFNISHSGEYAVCAVSKESRVGVDIEQIRKVDIGGFDRYLTPEQMADIKRADNPLELFFKNWTSLESILKAQGDGFSGGIPDIKQSSDTSFLLNGTTWYTKEIRVDSGYFCTVSLNSPEPEVLIQNIDIDMF